MVSTHQGPNPNDKPVRALSNISLDSQQPGGGATGMTGANADAGLAPKSFVAVVAQTYACPLVSPRTVMGDA